MTQSIWQRLTLEPEISCDVAIVGGGIIGCSTAYWLRQREPALQVCVVEAGRLAQGASGRNAGFLLQGTSTDYLSDIQRYGPKTARRLGYFTKENRRLIGSVLRHRAFQLEESGSLTVAGSREEDARLQGSVSRMRADGFPVAYISPTEVNQRLMSQGFGGGLFVSSGAMLQPVGLVRHIAERSGAQVLEQHRVLELCPSRGRIVVETGRRRIIASQVVLALNAYLPLLLPELSRFVRPVRAQMLCTAPLAERWLKIPIYSHEGYFYLRQLRDGTLVLGGGRHLHRDEERGYEDRTTAALQQDLEDYLHQHFPQTKDLPVRHRWSGVMGFSPDQLPVWGPVPELTGSFWAAGFTGHGMGYGFRFGQLLADITLGTTSGEFQRIFSQERFSAVPAAQPGASIR